MKIKYISIIITCFIIFACKSYLPFSSRKDKRESIKILKDSIELSNAGFNFIKNKDSILYELSLSVKKEVNPKLIKRRLDSLILEDYTRKEFLVMLKIDRVDSGFELDRKADPNKLYKIDNMEDLEVFMKKLNSLFNRKPNIKVKTETVKVKKNSL